MDFLLRLIEFLLWGGIFNVSLSFVTNFLTSKFMQPKETAVVDTEKTIEDKEGNITVDTTDSGTSWNEMKESIIALISRACALSFITILIYFFREGFYKMAMLASIIIISMNLVVTIKFVVCWLDEKFNRAHRKTFEHSYYFLVIFLFIFIGWLNSKGLI